MARMAPGSPEISVLRNYIDWIVSLPWGKETTDNMDLAHARSILDQDHYGLAKVKDRIIEFLAVRKLKMICMGQFFALPDLPVWERRRLRIRLRVPSIKNSCGCPLAAYMTKRKSAGTAAPILERSGTHYYFD